MKNIFLNKKTPREAGCFYFSLKLSAESWRSLFGPALSAIDRSVWSWFKRKFCDFYSALGAFPVTFYHFSWGKSSIVIVSVEHFVDFSE